MSDEKPKVVSIKGTAHVASHEPIPAVVEMLERWLEAAKEGEIRGVAMVGVLPDGAAKTNWEPSGVAGEQGVTIQGTIGLIAGVAVLSHKLFHAAAGYIPVVEDDLPKP